MKDQSSLSQVVFDAGLPLQPAQLNGAVVSSFIKRYIWVILGVFAFTVVSAYGTLSFLTELYETESGLLVKIGRENLDPPAVSKNVPLTAGLRREEVVSEISILHSPELISDVVDSIGVEAFRPVRIPPTTLLGRVKFEIKRVARAVKDGYKEVLYTLDLKKRLNERDTVIAGLMDGLNIDVVKESDVISIKLRMPDPGLAERVEQRLIDLYLQRRIDIKKTGGVKEFLDELATNRQEDLKKVEARRNAWKQQKGLYSSSDQKALLLQRIQTLSAASANTKSEIEGTQRQLDTSKELLASTPAYQRTSEQQTPNPAAQSLKEKLIALETERTRAMSKYQPESQVMQNLEAEIASIRQLLGKEEAVQIGSVTSQLNPNRQLLEQKAQQDRIRLAGLRENLRLNDIELGQVRAELREIESADGTLTDMERARQVAEQEYLSAMKRKFDSDLSSQLDKDRISNVSVLMKPTSTLEPVYPRKLFIAGISLLAGLLLGIGLALLLNYLNDRVDRAEDVELATGLRCLGTVSQTA